MGTKAAHDYSPILRKAFYEGLLKAAKKNGMTLSEYIATWWEKDWAAAAAAYARFSPREATVKGKIDINHHLPDQNTSKAWLEQQMKTIEGQVLKELEEEDEDREPAATDR